MFFYRFCFEKRPILATLPSFFLAKGSFLATSATMLVDVRCDGQATA